MRWLLQSDVIIPKTVHKERMQENLNLFDFELDAEDMQKIAALDTAHSLFLDHHDGETTSSYGVESCGETYRIKRQLETSSLLYDKFR